MSLGLAYGAEHQRYKMCAPSCASPTAATQYYYDPTTGGASELYTAGAAVNAATIIGSIFVGEILTDAAIGELFGGPVGAVIRTAVGIGVGVGLESYLTPADTGQLIFQRMESLG